ncbi:MAG: hypothetical protein AAFV96_18265, partial [Pseudomonadota bacterium]
MSVNPFAAMFARRGRPRVIIPTERLVPLFLMHRETGEVVGGVTLSNIRRDPAQAGTLGYWTGG